MIIKKINIINYGRLSNFKAELSDGINIIEGKNESGKLLPAHRNASC